MHRLLSTSLIVGLVLATAAYQDPLQAILPGLVPSFEEDKSGNAELDFVRFYDWTFQ